MLFADLEADDLLPGLTRAWCLCIGDEAGQRTLYADAPGYAPIRAGMDRLRSADKIAFHNGIGYDFWAINKLFPGTLRRDQIVDTLVICRMIWPGQRHGLAMLGERIGFPKLEFDDFSKFSAEMAVYCERDVEIMQKFWPKISEYYGKYGRAVECEHAVGFILCEQESHGFRLDLRKARALEDRLRAEQTAMTASLKTRFQPIVTERWSDKTGKRLKDAKVEFNPGSRPQIAARLMEMGWQPEGYTETGQPEVNEEVLRRCKLPEARALIEYLNIDKKLGQLADGPSAWMRLVDGRSYVHGSVMGIGCRTHRMSHAKPNMAQVDSSEEMRELWLPDPGHVLVGCDADSLELRVLAHYLAPLDGGEFARSLTEGVKAKGTDAHSRNQRVAGLYYRDSAKTLIYAVLYGAGNAKLGKIVIEDAEQAGVVLKGSPSAIGGQVRGKLFAGVTGLKELTEKVTKLHERHGKIPAIDGRPIPSNSAHSALNTLLQSTGGVLMKHALVLLRKRLDNLIGAGLAHFCVNCHDEWQISVHPEHAESVGEAAVWAIEEAGRQLGMRCPMAGNYQTGQSWAETH